eukprot:gene7416-biopygen9081
MCGLTASPMETEIPNVVSTPVYGMGGTLLKRGRVRAEETRGEWSRRDQTRLIQNQITPGQNGPDQTRPDQTRPAQTTRPDQTRPDQTRTSTLFLGTDLHFCKLSLEPARGKLGKLPPQAGEYNMNKMEQQMAAPQAVQTDSAVGTKNTILCTHLESVHVVSSSILPPKCSHMLGNESAAGEAPTTQGSPPGMCRVRNSNWPSSRVTNGGVGLGKMRRRRRRGREMGKMRRRRRRPRGNRENAAPQAPQWAKTRK